MTSSSPEWHADPVHHATPPSAPPPAPLNGPPRRVLVVDDDPTVAEVVTGYLDRAGYAVDRAADGSAALDRAAGAPARPRRARPDAARHGRPGGVPPAARPTRPRGPGDHAHRARRRGRPHPRPGDRAPTTTSPSRSARASWCCGSSRCCAGRRPRRRPRRAGARTARAAGSRVDPAARRATKDGRRTRPHRSASSTCSPSCCATRAGLQPGGADARGVGLGLRRPVHGHRPCAAAAREGRGRPGRAAADPDGLGRRLPLRPVADEPPPDAGPAAGRRA